MIENNLRKTTTRRLAAAAALVATTTTLALSGAPAASAAPVPPIASAHDLKISLLQSPEHSAGHSYVDLVFRNVSDHEVRMYGFSGVSSVAYQNGTQLGEPAVWDHSPSPKVVRLRPGAQTTEVVAIASAGNWGSGHTVTADGFRVYPPHSRVAVFVPFAFTASTREVGQLQTYAIGADL